MIEKPKIFISYCAADSEYREHLNAHLYPLINSGIADVWFDGLIKPGDEWEKAIDDNINQADIILLLISVHFINSKYCSSIELKKAIERHQNGFAKVIPIFLSHCYWENQPFARFQALPNKAKPISSFADKDEAYTQIANEIAIVIKGWHIPIKETTMIEKMEKEEVQRVRQREESVDSFIVIMPWREYWNQLQKVSDILAYCDYTPNFIFGIANGGLIVADFISRLSFPNIPVFSLWADRTKMPSDYFSDIYNTPLLETINSQPEVIEILLVDDNISTGQTFIQAALFLKKKIPNCRIAYIPLFTKNKRFMKIPYMDEFIIWHHPKIKSNLSTDFNFFTMHLTNYYEFPYGKGIKNIN